MKILIALGVIGIFAWYVYLIFTTDFMVVIEMKV